MNVEKNKSNKNFKTTIPSKIMIDQKQLENVEFLNIWVAF